MVVYSGGTTAVDPVAIFMVADDGSSLAPVGASNPLPTSSGVPTAANVLVGSLSHTATTAAATFLTVPAGRTWAGVVGVSCAVAVVAAATTAGQARAVITTAGVGATPAAGTVLAVEAKAGANAATGTAGSNGSATRTTPLTVVAPAGNSVTLQLASTITGTVGVVDVTASGSLA